MRLKYRLPLGMPCFLFIAPLFAIIVQQSVGVIIDYKYASGTSWTVYAYLIASAGWFWLGANIGDHLREVYTLLRWLVYSCLPFCLLACVGLFLGGKAVLDLDGGRVNYMLPFWGAQESLMFAFCYFAACLVTRADKWTVICLLLSGYNLISLNKQGVFVSGIVIFACSMFWVLNGERMSLKACRLLVVVAASALLVVVCGVWLETTASGGVAKEFILKRHFHVQENSSVSLLFSMDAVTTASANRLDEIWVEVWRRICENPVIGSGFNQTVVGRTSAHNGALDMLMGMGLLGFIPFAFGNVLCLYRGIRAYFRCRDGLGRVVLLSFILYVLSFIGANMGDVQRKWISSGLVYGFCLGGLYGFAGGQGKQNERGRHTPRMAAGQGQFAPAFKRRYYI